MTATPVPSESPTDLGARQVQAQENFQKFTDLMGKGQQMMMEFWTKEHAATPIVTDPMGFMSGWQKAITALMSDPARLMEQQQKYMADAMMLWKNFISPDAEKPTIKDKRFANEAWSQNPAFDFLRQSYLLTASHFMEAAHQLDGLEPAEKAKAQFLIKQFVDAMSPSNFALTNPEVLKTTAETGGANLLRGLEHLLGDLQTGRMKMTDENAFEVGRNVAITPGKVVFQNRLLQLIQYQLEKCR